MTGLVALAFAVLWFGYGVTTWAYIILKGWNVSASDWFSPLSTWNWPKSGNPPGIPPSQVWPGKAAAAAAAAVSDGGGGSVANYPKLTV